MSGRAKRILVTTIKARQAPYGDCYSIDFVGYSASEAEAEWRDAWIVPTEAEIYEIATRAVHARYYAGQTKYGDPCVYRVLTYVDPELRDGFGMPGEYRREPIAIFDDKKHAWHAAARLMNRPKTPWRHDPQKMADWLQGQLERS